MLPIVTPPIWKSYIYRIHEISYRWSAGTAMRYDTLFRANLAHRASVRDPNCIIEAELQVIDRSIVEAAEVAAQTAQGEQRASNARRQREIQSADREGRSQDSRAFAKQPVSSWFPWNNSKANKGGKGNNYGKGARQRDRYALGWNQASSFHGTSGNSVFQDYGRGTLGQESWGQQHVGYGPLQGPTVPVSTVYAAKAKGKGAKGAPY